MEVLNSIIDNWSDDFVVLIGDQNHLDDYSVEKHVFYETACAYAHTRTLNDDHIKVVQLPFDCGLSYARNKLVEKAHELGVNYCLIGADSIKFTESMQQVSCLTRFLSYNRGFGIDLLGFELKDRIGWEAKLDLKNSFILDFIDKTERPDEEYAMLDNMKPSEDWICGDGTSPMVGRVINIFHCDIVRNFFLASTKSLLDVRWDDNLKMAEHEDFFWRYKQEGYKVGWTNYCEGEYAPCIDNKYKQLRNKNMRMGKEYLKLKWELKSWVKYIHLERTKIKGK
jgi:hypothetical protein